VPQRHAGGLWSHSQRWIPHSCLSFVATRAFTLVCSHCKGTAVVNRTTRITVETDTFLVIRRAKTAVACCPDCCAEVDVITLTPDSIAEPSTSAQVGQWAATGRLHLWHTADGVVQICVTSLRCSV